MYVSFICHKTGNFRHLDKWRERLSSFMVVSLPLPSLQKWYSVTSYSPAPQAFTAGNQPYISHCKSSLVRASHLSSFASNGNTATSLPWFKKVLNHCSYRSSPIEVNGSTYKLEVGHMIKYLPESKPSLVSDIRTLAISRAFKIDPALNTHV